MTNHYTPEPGAWGVNIDSIPLASAAADSTAAPGRPGHSGRPIDNTGDASKPGKPEKEEPKAEKEEPNAEKEEPKPEPQEPELQEPPDEGRRRESRHSRSTATLTSRPTAERARRWRLTTFCAMAVTLPLWQRH